MIENYEELANAIILQAVKDYRLANKVLSKNPQNKDARKLKNEVTRFFKSKWFKKLSHLNGLELLKELEEEI